MCAVLSCFSRVWLFATLWTIAYQVPLSMGFSTEEYWSGLPCPPPGDLLALGIEPMSLLMHLQMGSLPLALSGKPWKKSAVLQRKWAVYMGRAKPPLLNSGSRTRHRQCLNPWPSVYETSALPPNHRCISTWKSGKSIYYPFSPHPFHHSQQKSSLNIL